MSRTHVTVLLLLVSVFVLAQFLSLHSGHRAEATQKKVYGRFTAQQAIERSRPIFLALLPEPGDLYLCASHGVSSRHGRLYRYWSIECSDAKGTLRAYLTQDADTGRPSSITYVMPESAAPSTAAWLAPERATAKADDWLQSLGFTDQWHSLHEPIMGDRAWRIALRSADREALLTLDAQSGQLISAAITPTK